MLVNKKVILFIIFLAAFFLPVLPSGTAGYRSGDVLKPDSARECAICHYKWIDTFFIEHRSSELATMPDKPAVSTSTMCLSCHDGSTVDSRMQVFNDKRHQVGIIPSEKIQVPVIFPLDEEGKMDCATCHSAHGLSSKPGIEKTIFLRTSNKNSKMCIMCHADKVGGTEQGNHPIDITTLKIPEEIITYGGHVGSEANQVICETCHVAHGGFTHRRLVLPIDQPATHPVLCEACHTRTPGAAHNSSISRFSHSLDVPPGKSATIPKQWRNGGKVVLGTGGELVCRTCHVTHGAVKKRALLVDRNHKDSLCLQCHKDQEVISGSSHDLANSDTVTKEALRHLTAGMGPCSPCHLVHEGYGRLLSDLKIKNSDKKPGEFCKSCHCPEGSAEKVMPKDFSHPMDITLPEKIASLSLPLFDEKGIHVNGKIRCSTCHAFHNPFPLYDDPVEKDIKHGKYLRLAKEGSSTICIQCHPQHGLIEGTDHDLSITAPAFVNTSGLKAAQGGVCSPCHLAHKAVQQKYLWSAPTGPDILEGWNQAYRTDNDMMTMLCTGCHSPGKIGEIHVPEYGLHPKGFLVPEEEILTGKPRITFEMVKNEFPIFTDAGVIAENGNIVCSTCHNPHQWAPHVAAKGPGKKIEGNVTSSFLRPNLHSKFCTECHGKDGLIKFKYFHSHISRVKKESPFSFE